MIQGRRVGKPKGGIDMFSYRPHGQKIFLVFSVALLKKTVNMIFTAQ